MRPDALLTLIRLRRHTAECARTAFADALRRQDAAEREVVDAEAAIHAETDRASDPASGDGLVEAFAAWLPQGRRRVAEAQAALDHAVAEAAQARTALSLARAALEAVEELAEAAEAEAATASSRREQDMLDEAARRAQPTP